MALEHLKPEGLLTAHGYVQAIAATGGRSVYVAGQGAYDAKGKLVGRGDHAAQARQAFRNVATALAAAGARPEHVVKATIYVVGLTDEVLAGFTQAMNDALDGKPFPPTASTLVGVERLAYREMLIEIDAIAVV